MWIQRGVFRKILPCRENPGLADTVWALFAWFGQNQMFSKNINGTQSLHHMTLTFKSFPTKTNNSIFQKCLKRSFSGNYGLMEMAQKTDFPEKTLWGSFEPFYFHARNQKKLMKQFSENFQKVQKSRFFSKNRARHFWAFINKPILRKVCKRTDRQTVNRP